MTLKSIKKTIISAWKKEKYFIVALAAILLIGGFLRLYKLEEFITFLGDQGRDAIVMKRIVTLEDFPGIGPRSSVGQLFLGPFYYYFMAPFLLLFNFSPVGPAFGVALLSLIALAFFTWKIKRDVNMPTAFVFASIIALSYVNIWLTRFSWNPNLLPVFSFFTAYFLWRLIKKPGIFSGAFFGFFLAASLQLHYLMLLVLPALFGYIVYGVTIHFKNRRKLIESFVTAATTFGLTFSPLIIFDIKNNFLNFKGLLSLFTEKQFQSQSTFIDRLNDVLNNLLNHVFQITTHGKVGFILLAVLIILGFIGLRFRNKFNEFVLLHVFMLLSFIIFFAVIDSERYQHYFTPAYYSFFVILAYLISLIKPRLALYGAMVLFILGYGIVNAKNYWFLQQKGNFQTRISESIADSIISMNVQDPYHIVSIPLSSTNDHIRYYLELKSKTPLSETSIDKAENLVILCYEKGPKACNVYDENQYQVVIFGDRKIAQEINHPEDVRIFRLIHAN